MIKYIYILLFSIIFSVENISDNILNSIDVENKLGTLISGETIIINEDAKIVSFQDFYDQEIPTILVLAYYRCPMLCTLVLNGVSDALSKSALIPGKDYNVLTVSIDPTENPTIASEKKSNYITEYFPSEELDFWTFGTSTQETIDYLTDNLGFKYTYDEINKQYAHPAVIYVISDEGILTSQLLGIQPGEKNMRLSILESQQGSVSSVFDKLLLYCYRYDPNIGAYTLVATNVMKIAGVITIFVISIFLYSNWRKESTT